MGLFGGLSCTVLQRFATWIRVAWVCSRRFGGCWGRMKRFETLIGRGWVCSRVWGGALGPGMRTAIGRCSPPPCPWRFCRPNPLPGGRGSVGALWMSLHGRRKSRGPQNRGPRYGCLWDRPGPRKMGDCTKRRLRECFAHRVSTRRAVDCPPFFPQRGGRE